MEVCVSGLRDLVGADFLLVANGNNTLYDYCDGDTRENFPEMHGQWYENMMNEEHGYLAYERLYRQPTTNIINTVYENYSGPQAPSDPTFMREFLLGLTSTLVFGSGYYSCDATGHSVMWWTDYHDVDLGRPIGRAEDAEAYPGDEYSWVGLTEFIKRRRFENGIAVINPSFWQQEVQLGGAYYDIQSWNGQFYEYSGLRTSVTLGIQSGEVLIGNGVLPASKIDNFRARRDRDSVVLAWEPVDGAERYSVYRAKAGAGGPVERMLLDVVSSPGYVDDDAAAGVEYLYYVAPIDDLWCEGQQSRAFGVSREPGSDLNKTLSINEQDGLLDLRHEHRPDREQDVATAAPSMAAVWPLPASTTTTIAFTTSDDERWAEKTPTRLTVYDVAGRRVRRLLCEPLEAGKHEIVWDLRTDSGRQVASGCYQCVLETGGTRHSVKALVLR
jgi:hypothetical protein